MFRGRATSGRADAPADRHVVNHLDDGGHGDKRCRSNDQVSQGEALTLIAAAYAIPVQALMEANQLTDPDYIAAGQFLIIPRREDIVAEVLPPTVAGQTAPRCQPSLARRTAAPTTT